ncbi:MAG TPA: AmmeMemoRadiSam system protein A [Casimicrobiaceae bacterium]
MPTDDLGRQLVAVARHAIAGGLRLPAIAPTTDGALDRPGATFVTLFCRGELRGCIGSLKAIRAVGIDVRENALAAAFRDPRFPPLLVSEFEATAIEISLLSPRRSVRCASEEELRARLRPGVDGVALEIDEHRATFLPQVWDALPDPRDFLAALKEKARLPHDFWSPRLNVSLYQVTKWKESELVQTQASL